MERRGSSVLCAQVRAAPHPFGLGDRDSGHPRPQPPCKPRVGKGTRFPTSLPAPVGAGTLGLISWQELRAVRGTPASRTYPEPAAPTFSTPDPRGGGRGTTEETPRFPCPLRRAPTPHVGEAHITLWLTLGGPSPSTLLLAFFSIPAIYFPRRKKAGVEFHRGGSVSAPRDLAFWTECCGSALSSCPSLKSRNILSGGVYGAPPSTSQGALHMQCSRTD